MNNFSQGQYPNPNQYNDNGYDMGQNQQQGNPSARFSPIEQQRRNSNPFEQGDASQAPNNQAQYQQPQPQPQQQNQYYDQNSGQYNQPPMQQRPQQQSRQPRQPMQGGYQNRPPMQQQYPQQGGRPNAPQRPQRPQPPGMGQGAPNRGAVRQPPGRPAQMSNTAELLPRDKTGNIRTFQNYNRQGIENVSYTYNFGENASAVRKKQKTVPKGLIVGVVAAVFVMAVVGVFYVIRPQITITGTQNDILSYGAEYEEKGATGTFLGDDISEDILISGTIDNTLMGKQEITYSYKLPVIPIRFSETRIVTVEDFELPVIALVASDTLIQPINTEYIEPGFSAHDNFDGDLSSAVTVEGQVNTATEGVYTITYKATDSNGNVGMAERRVTVTEDSPLTAPLAEFSLEGLFPTAILAETEDAGDDYINSTIFFGDSVIENLALMDNQVPFENVWCLAGISALDAEGEELRVNDQETTSTIIDLLTTHTPERVLMSLGTNVVSYVDVDEYVAEYEKLITNMQAASPNTDIIIMSLTPVMREYDQDESGLQVTTNNKVNIYNYHIAEMCARLGIYFLDVAPELKDIDGTAMVGLIRDYDADGIHPRVAGNDVILEYYRTHALIKDEEI